jgi:membrane-bound lytic murein transglycosylase F
MIKSKLAISACVSLPLFVGGCVYDSPTVLQQIKAKGELVVATRYSPTTYYIGPSGETGFEYDLARRFADYLGVDLKIVTGANASEVMDLVKRGEANFAAAGIPVTDGLTRQVRFGPSYQEITPQLIYRLGNTPPGDLEGLQKVNLDVAAGSIPLEILRRLRLELPGLSWTAHNGVASGELLAKVWKGEYQFTVANSNEVAFLQQFYPELRVAFDLTAPKPLAWVFPHRKDSSLYYKAYDFFRMIKANGVLDQITERYYGHLRDFDYVGTRRFMRHVDNRLPRFSEVFHEAAQETGFDWRLLAAIGYQESHWNPHAVSPTGVRGLMMLTQDTAQEVQIDNRNDPTQSILGGARYFKMIKDSLPDHILEPDRTWLALAAYNIGAGHLEDARIITQQRGGDPDAWMDVKENLPLLRKKQWYKHTKCGYARGDEAVDYVENIRLYYDMLVWAIDFQKSSPTVTLTAARTTTDALQSQAPAL